MADKVSIGITRYRVNLEPPVDVFHVAVTRGDGVWDETCTTPELLQMFLQGVRAGCEGYVTLPEIPERAEPLPKERPRWKEDIPADIGNF